jgi:transcriptional regulator with XRE-family HTH domain
VYCTTSCRRAAQRQRSRPKEEVAACAEAPVDRPIALAVAEEIQLLASRLLDAYYGEGDLARLMTLSDQLGREVEDFQSAAVHDARAAGTNWREVGDAAKVSPATAQGRWNSPRVRRRLEQRARDNVLRGNSTSPVHGRGNLDAATARGLPPGRDEPVARAGAKLASALSFLHRKSGLMIQDVASSVELSASYLSRILTGERLPVWPVIENLAEIYASDPRDLRMLWEAANGMTPVPRGSVPAAADRLRAALRGLHLAAGSPPYDDLVASAGGALSLETVTDLLHGEGIPWWPATSRLVALLGGLPGDIRPLWQALHYSFLASCGIFPALGDGEAPRC